MWLLDYVTKNSILPPQGETGNIRSFSEGKAQVKGSSDFQQLPVVVPYGIAYVPTSGCKTAVVPLMGSQVSMGIVDEANHNLQPGEIMLYSAGGAKLELKNDGNVYINGVKFKG